MAGGVAAINLFSLIDRASDALVAGLSCLIAASVVFLIHEAGHYFVARMCGVAVKDVTIGVGREVWARVDSSGTRWSLRIYPFCGTVHIEHEDDPAGKRKTFADHKLSRRMAVVAAGPLANVALAFGLIAIFYASFGQPVTPPLVSGVESGSPAARAGLQPGDLILAAGGAPVDSFEAVRDAEETGINRPLSLTVSRGGKILHVSPTPYLYRFRDVRGFSRAHARSGMLAQQQPLPLSAIASVAGRAVNGDDARARALLLPALGRKTILGIRADDGLAHDYEILPDKKLNAGLLDPKSRDYGSFYPGDLPGNVFRRESLPRAAAEAWRQTIRLASGILSVAGRFGPVDREMLKPETTVSRANGPVRSGLFAFVHMTSFFSLCIALINLLPLPGTDGSFLLEGILEAAAGDRRRALIMYPYALRLAILAQMAALALMNIRLLGVFLK